MERPTSESLGDVMVTTKITLSHTRDEAGQRAQFACGYVIIGVIITLLHELSILVGNMTVGKAMVQ